ncbi:MAG: hypothetical protein VCB26_13115 [Candidatus Hydrogenedentota bacterium]
MKSAYEKAMERLNAASPPRQLSDEEKAEISDIETHAAARIAELRLGFDTKIAVANPIESAELQQEMAAELVRIEEKRDAAKDEIWNRDAS